MIIVSIQYIALVKMSDENGEKLLEWLIYIGKDETLEAMKELELRTDGPILATYARFGKWLTGDYSADDFVESGRNDPELDLLKREESRAEFIARTLWEVSGSTITDPNYTVGEHPLSLLMTEGSRVQQSFIKLRDLAAETIQQQAIGKEQNGGQPREEDRILQDAGNLVAPAEDDQDNVKSQEDGLGSEIKKMLIRLESKFEGLMADYQDTNERVKRLEAERLPQRKHQGPISSTRMEIPEQASYNDSGLTTESTNHMAKVTFQVPPLHNSSSPINSRMSEERRQLQRILDDVQAQMARLDRLEQNQDGSRNATRQNNNQVRSDTRSMSDTNRPIDVGSIVRKWQIKFNGEKGSSIEYFLTRIEECNELTGLSDRQILGAIPLMLTGVAATWYRNNRDNWDTWQEFCRAARKWYGVKDFQHTLRSEALARTQGEDEPVRDYITNLQSYLKKMDPEPNMEQQVDLMIKNMRPKIKKLIRPGEVHSVEQLMLAAVDVERTLNEEKYFKPPPSPGQTILPHLGWKQAAPSKKPSMEIAATATKDDKNNVGEMFDLIQALVKKVDSLAAQKQWNQRRATGDHISKQPPKSGKSHPSQADGGKSKDSTQEKEKGEKTQKKDMSQVKCFHCNKLGHIRPKCPERSGNEQ